MPITMQHERDNVYRVGARRTVTEVGPRPLPGSNWWARSGASSRSGFCLSFREFEGWERHGGLERPVVLHRGYGDRIEQIAIVGPERSGREGAMMFAAADLRRAPVEFFNEETPSTAHVWWLSYIDGIVMRASGLRSFEEGCRSGMKQQKRARRTAAIVTAMSLLVQPAVPLIGGLARRGRRDQAGRRRQSRRRRSPRRPQQRRRGPRRPRPQQRRSMAGGHVSTIFRAAALSSCISLKSRAGSGRHLDHSAPWPIARRRVTSRSIGTISSRRTQTCLSTERSSTSSS